MMAGVIAGGRPYSASGAPAIPTAGLVAWYKMDSIAGGVLVDEMGSYGGTLNDASLATGVVGSSIQFSGLSNSVARAASAAASSEFTINLWLKINSLTSTKFIFVHGINAGSDARNYHITHAPDYMGGRISFAAWNTSGAVYEAAVTSAVADTAWRMISICVSSSQIKAYENGVLVSTVPYAGVIGGRSSGFSMGAWERSGALTSFFYAACNIDQVRMYNRALSDIEIGQLYAEV